jgi:hypothetical protein
MRDYNVQEHHAHQHRKVGRRSPSEVLSWVKTPRFKEDLARAFFSARHTRTLMASATTPSNATGFTLRRGSPEERWQYGCSKTA